MSDETLELAGILKGHNGWVTSIATTVENPNMIVSGSRDKTIIVWKLLSRRSFEEERDESYGYAEKALKGHSHFVEDVVISSDGQFALSGSWDATLRLWDLAKGESTKRFVGHKKDVLSVAFSADNRQIVSGSRDGTIKLWNTVGVCKYTITDGGHTSWVSQVRFSPRASDPSIVSCGWDKKVKVWNLTHCSLKYNLIGHAGTLNSVTVSPDGTLCASGGKEGIAILWDLAAGKHLYSLDAKSPINALCFSPSRYWLCAATDTNIVVWHLETKEVIKICDSTVPYFFPKEKDKKRKVIPSCLSLAWSGDGTTLFAGYSDNLIRGWNVVDSVERAE